MSLTRRSFLWTAAASAVMVPELLRAQAPASVFAHGVASGDPQSDRVVLWTRVSPAGEATGPIDVRWQVAHDSAMTRVVASGSAQTSAERDFTVKVDAGGLEPGREYYYAFDAARERSPIGRTRTLPTGRVARVRLGVVSCANYPAGYFNTYRCLANRADLDAVLHLGDYMYEFDNAVYGDGTALGRIPEPRRETITLSDYRMRYATYRRDPDLQELHRQHPMIAVWDDHELTNDAWAGGAGNHNENEGDWPTRRAAAYKAYLEWLPIRELSTGAIHLYRSFRFGSLADLVMLDTRGLRDQQVRGDDLAGLADPRRSLLGAAQEAWLFDQLRTSQRDGTTWRLLGQQVLFSRVAYIGRPVPLADVWDGYQVARERVLEFLATEKIRDLAILAGDLHSSWAFDVPRNPWDGYAARTGDGSVAIEVVTPAVSSPPLFADPLIRQNAPALRFALPHLKYLEGESRGYLFVDLTPERMTAEWYYTPTVLERSTLETRAAGFVSERGSSRLAPA